MPKIEEDQKKPDHLLLPPKRKPVPSKTISKRPPPKRPLKGVSGPDPTTHSKLIKKEIKERRAGIERDNRKKLENPEPVLIQPDDESAYDDSSVTPGQSHSDTMESLLPSRSKPSEEPGYERVQLGKDTQAQRDHANRWKREKTRSGRDIAPLPIAQINWQRRLACKTNLKLFCETYLPNVFFKGWATDHLIAIQHLEEVILQGGRFAIAMPRAQGKTALCRAAIIWASAYGHRKFMYFVGATQPKAEQTLSFVKMYWYRSSTLQCDFPEIAWPILKLENRYHMASGQTFNGDPTHVIWGGDSVRFPCLLLPRDVGKGYDIMDPGSVLWDDELQRWMPIQAGIMIATAGIDGSIRGEADIHPITLEQPRPDIVLLDDVQKDSKADSPTTCEKLIRLIDGAVSGLSAPGEHIAALMPCTVIREGDIADTYLDPILKPDWNGLRCKLVIQWPEGITDFEIRQDTVPGKHWNKYAELRRSSLLQRGDISFATEYYREHRAEMDEGFIVSWSERFSQKGKNPELSAQQHAMELRHISPKTFTAEYQNIGRKLFEEGEIVINAQQLMQKTVDLKWKELPNDTEVLTAFIDVQNEGMFWQIFAANLDFTGIFPAWGLWPEVDTYYFTKSQLDSWSLLTNTFFKTYPELKREATRTTRGYIRAPFEAKIYFGLDQVVKKLMSMTFTRQDTFKRKMKIQKIAIDTRYGLASDVIKRYIKESGLTNTLIPYNGQSFPPTNRQLEEYEMRKGWLFEHQKHLNVKNPSWVYRPHQSDGSYYLQVDVSRMKDFLFARLASPKGTEGSISLPSLPAEKLEMICNHICSSEFPEPILGRGILKNVWQEREGSAWDNDYLDCSVGNLALASYCGCSLKTSDEGVKVQRRRLSTLRKKKAS